MKCAADFRRIAYNALKNRWLIAVIAGLIASLLGAIGSEGPKLNVEMNDGNFNASLQLFGQDVISSNGASFFFPFMTIMTGMAIYFAILAIVFGIVLFVLGSIVQLGYMRFNLDLIDQREEPMLGTLFGYFPFWSNAVVARFLQTVYILLWSLLFVIPGIVATYSYAMTGYILAEYPDMPANEAIERSKQMMSGNRWRLFCLHFSFIGWEILSAVLTCGLGMAFVTPYKQAATAAFYREVSGTESGYTYTTF